MYVMRDRCHTVKADQVERTAGLRGAAPRIVSVSSSLPSSLLLQSVSDVILVIWYFKLLKAAFCNALIYVTCFAETRHLRTPCQ